MQVSIPTATSRQQKRIDREYTIIAATVELLKDRGFMELRMSEVAKEAKCSMGAIYSHFSSKEDLLLGCTSIMMKERLTRVNRVLTDISDPLDKLLALLLLLWHQDIQNPDEYNLRQLAWNPSIWQRASELRHNQLQKADEEVARLIDHNSKLVLQQLSLPPTDAMADELMMSLGGITLGLSQYKASGMEGTSGLIADDEALALHINCLARVLKGWGIQNPNIKEHLQELNAIAVNKITP